MRSGPGEARTILLLGKYPGGGYMALELFFVSARTNKRYHHLHIISVRPSKQPLMVRTFLKVYMELGSYFLFLQEQIKDIIITGMCVFSNL